MMPAPERRAGQESLDSQQIMQQYQMYFEPGTTAPRDTMDDPAPAKDSSTPKAAKEDVTIAAIRETEETECANITLPRQPEASLASPDSTTGLAKDNHECVRHDDIDADADADTIKALGTSVARKPSHDATMEQYYLQDSNTSASNNSISTQAALDSAARTALVKNPYYDLVETQRADTNTNTNAHEDEPTLQDGDTGAVNFEPSLAAHQPSQFSQSSFTEEVIDFGRRGSWRNEMGSQLESARKPDQTPARRALLPETPTTNHNPFAKHPRASVLAASQLFQPTQLLPSSARRGVSPTSSRPSPNMFHNFTSPAMLPDTSPIKRQAPPSSSPAPQNFSSPMQDSFSTPVSPAAVGNITQDTPPLSQYVPRRLARRHEPMSQYEHMPGSQRMGSPEQSDPDESETDLMFQKHVGRVRTNRLRREAANDLADMSESPRPAKRRKGIVHDSDPTPAIVPRSSDESPRKKKGSRAEDVGKDDTPGPVIRDSQETRPSAKTSQSTANEKHIATSSNEAYVPATSPVNTPTPGQRHRLDEPNMPSSPLVNARLDKVRQPKSRAPQGRRTRRPTRTTRAIVSDDPDADELAVADPPTPAPAPASVIPETPSAELSSHQDVIPSSPPLMAAPAAKMTPSVQSSTLIVSPAEDADSTSSLTELSRTPSAAGSTPTESKPESPHSSEADSPARESRGRPSLPRLAMKKSIVSTRSTSRAKQTLSANVSMSTDELAWSPAGLEKSMVTPKAQRSERSTSRRPVAGPAPKTLFAGMVFAISFQNQQKGESNAKYGERAAMIQEVETALSKRGGKIISNGFHELFEASSMKTANDDAAVGENALVKLRRQFQDTGFTALVADGHSRKIKYMEALALGIPCVSYVWVTKCVASGKLINWLPYLLCSGQSTLLGDAVASRSLAPYPAAGAKLANILARRDRLLDTDRILLVVKQNREDKIRAYVFLARVMGASVVVARTPDQARHALAQANSLGTPFNWLYFEGTGKLEDLMQTQAGPAAKGKKRKRGAAATAKPPALAVGHMSNPPRALSNELIIQSLILGQVIDEDDWAAHA